MRILTKPSTARCNIEMYVRYLISEPMRTTCTGFSEVLGDTSHDSINRFLLREHYTPEDLFNDVRGRLNIHGGVLSVDDMVVDKPYSDPFKSDLIGYYWSGKHKRVVKGINIITLYYTDPHGFCAPVNFRIYDPNDNKTKNEYFREMLEEALLWGLKPFWVTGDCWYSGLENLKFVRKYGLSLLFCIESNRIISIDKGTYIQVQAIKSWDVNGVKVYLKGFGMVKVFRQKCSNAYRYYAIALPKIEMLDGFTDGDFKRAHNAHWNIERFHRATKQLCNIEKFQVRNSISIRNHIFCSLISFIKLETARVNNIICNWYQLKKDLFIEIVRDFIGSGIQGIENSGLLPSVNA